MSKQLKGDPSETFSKNFKKSSSVPKIQKGDPIVLSGFVSYVKKGVNERGTLCTDLDAFPFAGPVV